MTETTYAIEVDSLTKKFGDYEAVKNISFNVPTGTVCGVLGPNGAGKTTMINMLATLSRPTDGTAKIFGYDLKQDDDKVRAMIGLTGQYATIDESLTAEENLRIFCRLQGLSRKASREKTADLLAEFSLTDAAKKSLSQFSGGMRRRLDLAASLIANPPLIFLDEPTTGLDPRTRTQMWETIRKLVAQGTTILLTTQYLDEADQLADNIIVIDHGEIVANGSPDSLKASIGNASLQLTVADANKIADAESIVTQLLQVPVQRSNAGELTAAMSDTSKLTQVLESLSAAGVALDAINVRKPSLDEVFFALTGK